MSFEVNTADLSHRWWDPSTYISLTMEFRCNLKCTHCMIEGTMDWLNPQSDDHFDRILKENERTRQWSGLILTGSEITLRKDLADLARRAKKSGFDHIRIQTHGMHLGNEKFCDSLIEAGIDEYFISVAGGCAETHDMIVKQQGSFERVLRGLQHLEDRGMVAITNTVVTQESFRELPLIVDVLSGFSCLKQMEFWNFFPMAEDDTKNLIVPFTDLMPPLKAAITKARELGRRVEVKNVPECLLDPYGEVLINAQPLLEIDDRFWDEFARNGFYQCRYMDQCASKECLGLNTAYIDKFGWEEDKLSPVPTTAKATA